MLTKERCAGTKGEGRKRKRGVTHSLCVLVESGGLNTRATTSQGRGIKETGIRIRTEKEGGNKTYTTDSDFAEIRRRDRNAGPRPLKS